MLTHFQIDDAECTVRRESQGEEGAPREHREQSRQEIPAAAFSKALNKARSIKRRSSRSFDMITGHTCNYHSIGFKMPYIISFNNK